jgi:heat shock protein HslJ
MKMTDPLLSVRRLMLPLGVSLALGACATSQAVPPLTGSEWRLSHIDSDPVLAQPKATLVFGADGRLSGHGTCNRFTGSYRLDGDRLTMGPVAATRIGCPGPVGQQEARYLQALQSATQIELKDGELLIRSGATSPVLRFLPNPR